MPWCDLWEFRQRNILWRIPADGYDEAVTLLCRILFVSVLPEDVLFVSGPA